MHTHKYDQASPGELADLDRALEIVGGSFVAAAKLVDIEPQRARNLIRYHSALRARWGRKRRGRPPNRLGLSITPFRDNLKEATWMGLEFAKFISKRLGAAERRELAECLVESNQNEPPTRGAGCNRNPH